MTGKRLSDAQTFALKWPPSSWVPRTVLVATCDSGQRGARTSASLFGIEDPFITPPPVRGLRTSIRFPAVGVVSAYLIPDKWDEFFMSFGHNGRMKMGLSFRNNGLLPFSEEHA